jgi:fructose-1,6-bisphosphatase/inositol monophosphatase family enzyme
MLSLCYHLRARESNCAWKGLSEVIEDVLAAMQDAAEKAILPRFRALQDGDVEEKSPGEVVTRADREAEALIAPVLKLLRPDATVVGEEATAANPSLLDAVQGDSTVWLLDPLDGTSNFVKGTDQFAVMVALMEQGLTTHAWIWQPLRQEAWLAVRGAGTTMNGERVKLSTEVKPISEMRGSLRTRFLDDEHRAFAETALGAFGDVLPGSGCAGIDYPEVATSVQDFLLFRRTLPWDHVPGALVLREAGGLARRWDGSEYAPGIEREGLIAASDESRWEAVASAFLQARHRAPQRP